MRSGVLCVRAHMHAYIHHACTCTRKPVYLHGACPYDCQGKYPMTIVAPDGQTQQQEIKATHKMASLKKRLQKAHACIRVRMCVCKVQWTDFVGGSP